MTYAGIVLLAYAVVVGIVVAADRDAREEREHHQEMIGFYRRLVSSGVDPEREGLFRRHIEEHQAELRRLT